MLNQIFSNEIFWVFVLTLYVGGVFLLTKYFYDWMIRKKIKKEVAMYYNRKIIHILAGGVIVIAVPFVFSDPLYPLLAGLILTIITYIKLRKVSTYLDPVAPHRTFSLANIARGK